MRAAIDANIFFAGLLNLEGGAAKIINHFRNNAFEIVITLEVFEEYMRVIHFFDNEIPPNKSEDLLELVFEKAVKAASYESNGLCKNPDYEKFLIAAISGNAGYLVTKNKKDFPHSLSGTRIVSVREFLKEIEKRNK